MGRRKSFIDKKQATTYYLVHKEVDDDAGEMEDEGDRELVTDEDFARRRAEVAEAASTKHPLSFLFVQEEDLVQSEDQRHDILELGLPDDGYNYLKHLRAPGPATSRLAAAPSEKPATIPEDSELQVLEHEGRGEAGKEPAEFLPPAEDVAFVDARGLTLQQVNEEEATAAERSTDVSAFSRPVRHTDKIERHTAVREVAALMREVEELDDTRELRDGAVPAPVLGEGTLLDDFVAEASRCDPDHTQQETGAERFDAGSMGGLPEDPEEWDFESAVGSEGSGGVAETFRVAGTEQQRAGPASIADSFWRPERGDRTYAQTVHDERLIQKMDVEYADDEIGSLEDEEEATRGRHFADGDLRVQSAIDDFLANYKKGHQVDLPVHWNLQDLTPEQMATLDDELVARIKAREAYERQVAAERAEEPDDDDHAVHARFACAPRERWDCESVLSLRSDVTYQPGRIEQAQRRRPCAAAKRDAIVLSGKTGLPVAKPDSSQHGSDDDAASELQGINLGAAREKGESTEDRKARKAAVKEAKRAAREAKKELRGIYSQEHARAQRHAATNKAANASVVCM